MDCTPGASNARAVLLAVVAAAGAAVSLAQAPEEKSKPVAPLPLPSVGIALEVRPHEEQPGVYAAKALVTDVVTGRRLSQSWVAVKVGSFADMRARVRPESGAGATVDMYMTVSIGADENGATLTTSYRQGGRLILKQETRITLGGDRGPGDERT